MHGCLSIIVVHATHQIVEGVWWAGGRCRAIIDGVGSFSGHLRIVIVVLVAVYIGFLLVLQQFLLILVSHFDFRK